jgi:hypothetical protein
MCSSNGVQLMKDASCIVDYYSEGENDFDSSIMTQYRLSTHYNTYVLIKENSSCSALTVKLNLGRYNDFYACSIECFKD